MNQTLFGIMPAIASPCDEEDNFLEDRFAQLAANLYREGVHGLYVCGTTGDGFRMRPEERKQATEIALEASRESGGKVIVHVGAAGSRDAMKLAEHAASAGAAAVASMPLTNCSQRHLVNYYADIADAARIPVLVYYIPALTDRTLTVDEMLELLDIEGVVGLKFSDYNLFFLKRVLQARPDVVAFSGEDQILCPALLYGAHGGIGMYYNVFPRLFMELYQAVGRGEIGRAMDLQNRLVSFLDVAFRYGIRETLEFILRRRGFGPCLYRRPQPVLDDETSQRLEIDLSAKMAAIEEASIGCP